MPRQPVAGDPWFISHTRQGFTNMPEYALKTADGHPIAAPGEGLKAAAHVLKHKSALWEHLLDAMEELYELEGQQPRDNFLVMRSLERCDILNTALAILNHGAADEMALRLTKAEADKRYALSVGE